MFGTIQAVAACAIGCGCLPSPCDRRGVGSHHRDKPPAGSTAVWPSQRGPGARATIRSACAPPVGSRGVGIPVPRWSQFVCDSW